MSKSGTESVACREDSVKTSLDDLREIEEKRLREEAEQEDRLRLEAEARMRADEERRRAEEEIRWAEEARAAEAARAEAQRARLLDVDARLCEQEKRLRGAFALEAVRIREDAMREAKRRPHRTIVFVSGMATIIAICVLAVLMVREGMRSHADELHFKDAAASRVAQFEKELRAERSAHADTRERYRRAQAELNRRGEKIEALEAGARKTGMVWRPPARKSSVIETRSSASPHFQQKGSIQVDTTQDPLGPLMK